MGEKSNFRGRKCYIKNIRRIVLGEESEEKEQTVWVRLN